MHGGIRVLEAWRRATPRRRRARTRTTSTREGAQPEQRGDVGLVGRYSPDLQLNADFTAAYGQNLFPLRGERPTAVC